MNVIRFPISWERIQNKTNAPLVQAYADSVVKVAKYVTDKGKYHCNIYFSFNNITS